MQDLRAYLGSTFTCSECGKTHRVRLGAAVCSDDALGALPLHCSQAASGKTIALVADRRTFAVAGRACERLLRDSGFVVRVLLVPDPEAGGKPVCDDPTRDRLENELPACDLMVAVGSGVVSDLTKWLCSDRGLPYVAVATAASMNGYASDNIAPTIRGVKKLLHGTGPRAVLTTPEILREAPTEMTAAGLGDVIAKTVSGCDWRVNQILFGEYYCPLCAGLIDHIEPIYMENPEAIGRGDTEGVQALFDALIFTGVSMSMAGTSSPASGGEHLISHTLDMMSALDGVAHDFHGRQVGVATILCAAVHQELLVLDGTAFQVNDTPPDEAFWGRFFEAVEENHRAKHAKMEQAVRALNERSGLWERIRATAASVKTPNAIKDCLRRAGAAHRIVDLGMDRERFLAALGHAHEIRERFTVLDLARCAGVLPEQAEELVDRWLV